MALGLGMWEVGRGACLSGAQSCGWLRSGLRSLYQPCCSQPRRAVPPCPLFLSTTWEAGRPWKQGPFPTAQLHFGLFPLFPGRRIFSELNSTEMHLIIVRGMNLPAPPGSPRATPTPGGSCLDTLPPTNGRHWLPFF